MALASKCGARQHWRTPQSVSGNPDQTSGVKMRSSSAMRVWDLAAKQCAKDGSNAILPELIKRDVRGSLPEFPQSPRLSAWRRDCLFHGLGC